MAPALVNESGYIGQVMAGVAENVTGDYTGAILLFVIIVIALALAFRIPVEVTALLILPLCLAGMAFGGQGIMVFGGVLLIFVGVVIAKNFPIH